MPKNFHYPPILLLASTPRMASYHLAFNPHTDSELYGIYIWAQHVVGAIYPITQNVEISLRNAIDAEARRRFGDFWWKLPQFNAATMKDFTSNLAKAENTLTRHWKNSERKRLGLSKAAPVPTSPPSWSHDKIIAATDFSTWEYILRDDFAAPNRAQNSNYLWPLSMSKIFRHYNLASSSNALARKDILDLVHEIREYRNRLFHHDKIWVSSAGIVTNARTAVDSIRKKINRMKLLINIIDSRLLRILEKVGVFSCARRVCSVSELSIYSYANIEDALTAKKKRVLRSVTSKVKAENITSTWTYGNSVYGMYKIR